MEVPDLGGKQGTERMWWEKPTSRIERCAPLPVGYSIVSVLGRPAACSRNDESRSQLTGNHTGPRQFELPPNSDDLDSAGS